MSATTTSMPPLQKKIFLNASLNPSSMAAHRKALFQRYYSFLLILRILVHSIPCAFFFYVCVSSEQINCIYIGLIYIKNSYTNKQIMKKNASMCWSSIFEKVCCLFHSFSIVFIIDRADLYVVPWEWGWVKQRSTWPTGNGRRDSIENHQA